MAAYASLPTTKTRQLILFLYALGMASFLWVCKFYPLSFDLITQKQLIIGDATLHGTDVSLRVRSVYMLILGGVALLLVIYRLLDYLDRGKGLQLTRHSELALISAALICLSFLQVMETPAMVVLKLLAMLFWVRTGLLWLSLRSPTFRNVLQHRQLFPLSLSYAFLLLLCLFFFRGGDDWVKDNPTWLLLILTLLLIAFYVACNRIAAYTVERSSIFLLPLSAVPVLAFLWVEIFCYQHLRHGHFIHFRLWFGISLLGLFLLHFLWMRSRENRLPILGKAVRNLLGPSLVFAFVLLLFYRPIQGQQTEMFEMANRANPLADVFRFGKLPFLDFITSHMLSEQWFGYLYSFLFGFHPTQDFFIYEFFNQFFFLLVLYIFLNKVLNNPFASLCFIFLFPLIHAVFYMPVFMGVVPLFLSKPLLEQAKPKTFFVLFLTLFGLILWRIDTGSAALMSSAFYFPILWMSSRKRFPLVACLKGLSLFLAVLLACILIAISLRSPQVILNNIQLALHYFTANQAHGFKQIIYDFTHQFYVLHVLFPAVAISACIYIYYTLKKQDNGISWHKHFVLLGALFCFLLFLANLQRGLVRHGYAERGEILWFSTFLAGIGLLVAYWCRPYKAALRVSIFYTVLFFSFYLAKLYPHKPDNTPLEEVLTKNAFRDFDSELYADHYGRTKQDSSFIQANYGLFKQFLDQHLKPGQTFLDFSNAPMLYYYCDRESPGYFCQNLQNSVDDFLQLALLKAVDTQKVPVVVFASYPREVTDHIDDVPNTLRHYLIAEYIFSHYRPYGVIGNKSIWVVHSFTSTQPLPPTDNILHEAESVTNLDLLPEYTGAFYSDKTHEAELELVYQKDRKDMVLQQDSLKVLLDKSLLELQHCYLSVEFTPQTEHFDPYTVNMYFTDTAQRTIVGQFPFTRRDKISSRYLLRLSNYYFWHRYTALELCIANAGGIERISILKDRRFENKPTASH